MLKNADIVLCEDTRVTNKLLSHYGIKAKMFAYNDHNAKKIRPRILEQIADGKSLALVSDAGTPLISDPGYKLIKELQEKGHHVTTIPGASSVTAAITLAGLPTDRFLFAGFLPPKKKARTNIFSEFVSINATMVFLERASRLSKVLQDISEVFGNREIAIVREITKAYEEVKKDRVSNLLAYYQKNAARGEIVIVIGPPEESEPDNSIIEKELRKLLKSMSLKEAVAKVTSEMGIAKKKVYSKALEIKNDK